MRPISAILTLGTLVVLAGCDGSGHDSEANDGYSGGFGDSAGGDSDAGAGAGCFSAADCGEGAVCIGGQCYWGGEGEGEPGEGEAPDPPDEPEQRVTFPSVPVPGDRYVFVAVPGSDTLARIHLDESLAVDEVNLQGEASSVAALPGKDVAVALTGSGEAEVVDSIGTEVKTWPVHVQRQLTHLTPSPTLPYVVAWSDHDDDGAGNPSEVSVIDLRAVLAGDGGSPEVWDLSVGNRPRDVVFDEAGARMMVVTDDGVSVVPDLGLLDSDGIARPIAVHEDALASAEGRRVLVTPDGRWALVVHPGDADLRLVDLDSGDRSAPKRLSFAAPLTDVVLVPSDDPGRMGHRALVVVREEATAALVDIPGDFDPDTAPEVFPLQGQEVGQAAVAPDGTFALLFTTTGSNVIVRVSLLDGVAGAERARAERLDTRVSAVAFAPSSRAAIAFHGTPSSEAAPSFTLMSFERRFFAKPFTTEGVAPRAFAFVPAEVGVEQVLLLLDDRGKGVREVLALPTDSFIARSLGLRAPPVSVGLVPAAGLAFVTQDDPEGLITFLALEGELDPRDVARFRRNRRID